MFICFAGVTYPVRFAERVLLFSPSDTIFLDVLTLHLLCCDTSPAKANT